jgi:hypothetical protein
MTKVADIPAEIVAGVNSRMSSTSSETADAARQENQQR